MINEIKVGSETYKIRDSSVLDKYRIIEKPFKEASDYRNGEMTTSNYVSNTKSICLTNIVKLQKPTIFSVKPGYKYFVACWGKDESGNGNLFYNQEYIKDFWTTEKTIYDKGQWLYVTIAKTNGENIDISEYKNLIIQELDDFHYGEYEEKNAISKIHFWLTGHANGNATTLPPNKQRCMSVEYLRFAHEVLVKNTNSNYGFTIFTFNDDGTEFLEDLALNNSGLWAGTTTEYKIPANTTFRLYIRKLDNSDLGLTGRTLFNEAESVLQLEVNTCDALKSYIDSQIEDAIGGEY